MELCKRGVLTEVSLAADKTGEIFSDDECRDVFQQMVLGIEYLHEHDIIHRDIKPDNLLRSEDGTLKIVDFGVSEMFKKGNDRTKKSAGSPAFMAPELARHDHGEVSGRATDIWSMGVTLFCIRYGRLPFVSTNILELNRVIREDDFDVSSEKDERFVHLIRRLLEKDPNKRITIEELRNDPWLTNDGKEPLISKDENIQNAVTEVTEEDLRGAIQRINSLVTVFKALSKFKKLIKNPNTSKATLAASDTPDSLDIADRMEDADETQNALASKLNHLSTSSNEDSVHEEATGTETNDASLSTLNPEEATHNHKQQEDDSQKEDSQKEDSQKEEPEGYQVCDMESGMCYWVPSKKSKTPSKVPRSASHVQKNEEGGAGQKPDKDSLHNTVASSSLSSPDTPAQSLVGKISKDRLALFEKQ
ncbi:hypothetical protein BGZ94_004875, partial [Podila epigama]